MLSSMEKSCNWPAFTTQIGTKWKRNGNERGGCSLQVYAQRNSLKQMQPWNCWHRFREPSFSLWLWSRCLHGDTPHKYQSEHGPASSSVSRAELALCSPKHSWERNCVKGMKQSQGLPVRQPSSFGSQDGTVSEASRWNSPRWHNSAFA